MDMITIFFAIIFIAELIIAIAIISKICQINKCVRKLDALVCCNKYKIEIILIDLRIMFEDFSKSILKAKGFIKRKREEYTFRALKTMVIYLSIFFLKGKYKKTILGYQVLKEIIAGITEAEF